MDALVTYEDDDEPKETKETKENEESEDSELYGPLFDYVNEDIEKTTKKQKTSHDGEPILDENLLPPIEKAPGYPELIVNPKKPGRYVSKREKEIQEEEKRKRAESFPPISVDDSIKMPDMMKIPPIIQKKIDKNKIKHECVLPSKNMLTWTEHTACVNCVRWSRPYGGLLASASMDNTVKIYDVFRSQKCVMTLHHHQEAVRDIQWNFDGTKLISAGYDKLVILVDVETGQIIQSYKHKEYVTAVQFHPNRHNLFLSGGFANGIACWDIGSNTVVSQFPGMFGTVQALEFINSGKQFVSSADVIRRNSVDKAVIVWDFDTGAVLSNQVYLEAYSCTSIASHPTAETFVAQSSGNYIAMFHSQRPYKMNRYRRFEGHHVRGFHVKCHFSPDGNILLSGSAEGAIFFWNFWQGGITKVIRAHRQACLDAVYHPILPGVVATCSWDKTVKVWDREKQEIYT